MGWDDMYTRTMDNSKRMARTPTLSTNSNVVKADGDNSSKINSMHADFIMFDDIDNEPKEEIELCLCSKKLWS